ncbi:MAG: hypothetical protein ABSA59_02735, partial [Terriglobia bacterium]
MRNLHTKLLFLFALGALILAVPHQAGCGAEQKVRAPGVAGGFYPADPKELTQMIDGFLAHNTVPQVPGPLVALICP